MDKVEKLIKEYLKDESVLGSVDRGFDCPDEQVLLEYLHGEIDEEKRRFIEHHIAGCGFCLSQLVIAYQSQSALRQEGFKPVSKKLIDKTKSSLGIYENDMNVKNNKTRLIKKRLFLAGAIIFFVLSFIIPKYFIQFLVATIILGMRWAFESEGGRTLIMVLDSWRHHSHDKDEEISHRLKKHL